MEMKKMNVYQAKISLKGKLTQFDLQNLFPSFPYFDFSFLSFFSTLFVFFESSSYFNLFAPFNILTMCDNLNVHLITNESDKIKPYLDNGQNIIFEAAEDILNHCDNFDDPNLLERISILKTRVEKIIALEWKLKKSIETYKTAFQKVNFFFHNFCIFRIFFTLFLFFLGKKHTRFS